MPGDHKRKARPIGPATMTITADAITVVVPDVLGKNESHIQARGGGRITSKLTEAYRASVEAGIGVLLMSQLSCTDWGTKGRAAATGAWRLEVLGVWPRERHGLGFQAPMGDADAAIPQALDALQHAGILDDDARVVEVRAWNLYRKGVRATIMRLVRVTTHDIVREAEGSLGVIAGIPERDADIFHLINLIPPSPEPAAKPKKQARREGP